MYITRAELKAAIEEAHKRGLKITGHLCSVTYPEAAALGIDDLEHGFFVNTELDPGKKPDQCQSSESDSGEDRLRVAGGQRLNRDPGESLTWPSPRRCRCSSSRYRDIRSVARHPRCHLAGSENGVSIFTEPRAVRLQASPPRHSSVTWHSSTLSRRQADLLLAGPDPTGNGGTIPGFGDLREIELLVEAGFTRVEGDQDRDPERGNLSGEARPDWLDRHPARTRTSWSSRAIRPARSPTSKRSRGSSRTAWATTHRNFLTRSAAATDSTR